MASRRGEVVLSGYLTKSPPDSRSAMSQWRRRWFVLADSKIVYPLAARYVRFEYYSNEEDAKTLADPKGVINLQLCHKVVSREPVRGHKYVFDVVTSERVYHLNAESADEKDEWIKTLCRLLFGGEGTSHSSLAAAGGSATSLPLPPPPSQPSPPSSTELYLSNSTYSEEDFTPGEAVASNGRDTAVQGTSRHLPHPPPPPVPRRDAKRLSENDASFGQSSKEESRKHSAPVLLMSQASGKSPVSGSGQEDSKKVLKQPPKVLPYKQHKKVAQASADYEMMEDDDCAPPLPPPPKILSRKSDVQDDYSVPDEVGPRVAPKKKADIRVETKPEPKLLYDSDYSYLQASPPDNDISNEYSHLDLSCASNENTVPNKLKPGDHDDDDNYSHLSH